MTSQISYQHLAIDTYNYAVGARNVVNVDLSKAPETILDLVRAIHQWQYEQDVLAMDGKQANLGYF